MSGKDNLMMENETDEKVKIIDSNCNSHCGGNCQIKVHVKGGKMIRIEPVETKAGPSMCLRGHAYRQRVYSPDRLLHPLKRTGPRGSGEFARISWDEALETVASELKRVKATYGNEAILHFCSQCDAYALHHVLAFHSLLCEFGGYTAPWGFISAEGSAFSEGLTYGISHRYGFTSHSTEEYANARLIIMWGWNPVTVQMGTNMSMSLNRAKEKGARFICVDPRYTDSAVTFADQWIPIRPGTDVAAMLSMAYVIITENLQDQEFIDTHTIGFDKFKDYVLGVEDGVAKTPEWAEGISGIPAATIADLAREFATTKSAVLGNSIGPGRSAYGEQYHRTAEALQAITGNHKFETRQLEGAKRFIKSLVRPPFPLQPNQVEVGKPPRWDAIPNRSATLNSSARVNVNSFTDAILKGKAGGYNADYKFFWHSNGNYINQLGNINKAIEAFKKLEFILVTEQFMSASARLADIVLPVCTCFERTDIKYPSPSLGGTYGGNNPEYKLLQKVIEPLGESRSQLQICQALAPKLGITNYPDKSDEELAQGIMAKAAEKGDVKPEEISTKKPVDPKHIRYATPSGKIEIYSGLAEKMDHPQIPALPKYIETWESLNDPLAEKYPLQLITPHFKRRAHSQFDNLPWLRELIDQAVTINSRDAEARGIKEGDMVKVFNDRGETRIPAIVTERIMPGVVSLPQGAWYDPDENGIDHGGSANILTRSITSPGGAFPCHTSLVQVEKA